MLNCKVMKYSAAENAFFDDFKLTSVETNLDIRLNGENFSSAPCSPSNLEELALGILAQAGKIRSVDDVLKISTDEKNSVVDVTANEQTAEISCHADCFKPSYEVRFVAKDILHRADELLTSLAVTHSKTNGVHCGVIFDQAQKKILTCREDIGRHNVFDKLFGWSILNRVDLSDKIIIFSGRCSSQLITKLWHMGIPALLAKSVPTSLAVSLAEKFGITLAAALTTGSFCVYTHPQRIVLS